MFRPIVRTRRPRRGPVSRHVVVGSACRFDHQSDAPSLRLEAIAILNWRLFPEKFSMVNFQEYPDAFRTNRSLLQMQPKYRNLLTGAATKGFSLNERGMDKAKELTQVMGVPTTSTGAALGTLQKETTRVSPKSAPRSIEPAREMLRIRESKLFEKWKVASARCG